MQPPLVSPRPASRPEKCQYQGGEIVRCSYRGARRENEVRDTVSKLTYLEEKEKNGRSDFVQGKRISKEGITYFLVFFYVEFFGIRESLFDVLSLPKKDTKTSFDTEREGEYFG